MKVFITGGAGFIGSHLCDALVARGDEVSILDNLSTGSKDNIAHLDGKIKVSQGDIRDQSLVESLVADSELVLHMAAALGVDNILENPIESISTNFYGSEIVLGAALKFDKRILIASTSEIYGKNTKQPLSETDDRVIGTPQKLRWTYSDAKALEEATAHFLFLTKQLRVTTIRFFNTVGPRQTGKYGMVIPRFIENALQNKPLQIYGDGAQKRCFLHIQDAIDAVVRVAFSPKTIGTTLNIGNDTEISILELAEKIISFTNSKSPIEFIPYKLAYGLGFEEMQRRVPNIQLINELVEWGPKLDLTNVITDIVKEFRSSKGL